MMSVDTPLPERLDAALRSRLGDGWLLGEDARRRHGEDSSKRWALPAAVALPRDVDDVVAIVRACREHRVPIRSEEHTSELQSLMRISYAVFSLKTKQIT